MRAAVPLTENENVLPMYFPSALVAFLLEKGANEEQLLKGTGLTLEAFHAPENRANFVAVRKLIANAEETWGALDLGLQFGATLNVVALGMVGQAASASRNLGEALETISRYLTLRDPLLVFTIERREGADLFVLNGAIDLGVARRFVVDTAFSATQRFVRQLLGGERCEVSFMLRHVGRPEQYRRFLGRNVEFGSERDSFSIKREAAQRPLPTASVITAREARQFCELELRRLGDAAGFRGVVTTLLQSRINNPPNEEEAARILGHSARNLRRRLAQEKTTFRQLVQQVRFQTASRYLKNTHLGVEQIALELGYRNVGNFSRAFRRWTGDTPTAFRLGRGGLDSD